MERRRIGRDVVAAVVVVFVVVCCNASRLHAPAYWGIIIVHVVPCALRCTRSQSTQKKKLRNKRAACLRCFVKSTKGGRP